MTYDPWESSIAWIRVFEDAGGVRVYEWIEPTRTEYFPGYDETLTTVPAAVTAPFPREAADPLGADWDAWDWAAALDAELAP